ncbi:hypothetical protein C5167_029376 [Papaver somniferum]|nr:hypothetical protein C5167_029376 [Papaver somniferum]
MATKFRNGMTNGSEICLPLRWWKLVHLDMKALQGEEAKFNALDLASI